MNNTYYSIEGTIVNKGNSFIPLQGGTLKSLSIINDYDNLVYPAILIKVLTDVDSYQSIKTTSKVKLSLRRFFDKKTGN